MKKHLTVFYILLSLLGIIAAIGIFILGFTALKKSTEYPRTCRTDFGAG